MLFAVEDNELANGYMKQIEKYNNQVAIGNTPSAWIDIYAIEDADLRVGESKLIKTGLRIKMPSFQRMKIEARSGLAYNHGIQTMAGVIDNQYRWEIWIILCRFKTEWDNNEVYSIKKWDRIAQWIIHKQAIGSMISYDIILGKDIPDFTERWEDWFWSSGK